MPHRRGAAARAEANGGMAWKAAAWAWLYACALCLTAPAHAETPFEREVLAAVNFARTDPAGYADALERYKRYFHGNIVSLPGQSVDFETSEGVRVVDETIMFLRRQRPMAPIAPAALLRESASDHSSEQGASGAIGHEGADGSSPGDRVRRHGGGAYVAEVIAYGSLDAVDAVRQLIVDDGVDDRGHRAILYSPELAYAGVSCGPHKDYRIVCVMDLGITPDGRLPATTRQAAVHRASPARTDAPPA
ncbi:CAP domain-containing protein [Sphingomonas nostoxanthinifaciens]|uniref:CAP domain-containing protein n=1 Tax=Sphingomonas nostoxanthinifaciens TaxID=2872652 RepID=UPI001CC1E9FE|nr:CAP domain-containing protein [Sphingomonas nostoxanthinifaciens]UAK22823.1 CAP domain-containing protein [Sphingomonas nostoxanthinifaciens]